MDIKKIFLTLIGVVACIIIGAAVLNIFLPNAVAQLSNGVENSIYQATGMQFDFNGDGTKGKNSQDVSTSKPGGNVNSTSAGKSGNVAGFKAAK